MCNSPFQNETLFLKTRYIKSTIKKLTAKIVILDIEIVDLNRRRTFLKIKATLRLIHLNEITFYVCFFNPYGMKNQKKFSHIIEN